jgi:hypothetical protein
VSLEVVFSGKRLVASQLGAGEGSFLVVASHVRLETTWPIEALRADGADVVPLPTGLALCPQGAAVRVVDCVVARVVRRSILLGSVLRSTSAKS